MHLKLLSVKWQQICHCLNGLSACQGYHDVQVIEKLVLQMYYVYATDLSGLSLYDVYTDNQIFCLKITCTFYIIYW